MSRRVDIEPVEDRKADKNFRRLQEEHRALTRAVATLAAAVVELADSGVISSATQTALQQLVDSNA